MMRKRIGRVVVVSLGLWLLCLVAFVGHLAVRQFLGDLGCEQPSGSSNYGYASWTWWPPGTSCRYDAETVPGYGRVTAHTEQPSPLGSAVAVALVVWPVVTVVGAARRLRGRRRTPGR